jgi:hypothetical protein
MSLDHLKKSPRKINPLDESGSPPPIAVTRVMTPEQAAVAPKGPCVAPDPPKEVKSVTYRCGHTELIARFKSGDCPPCRAKRKREKKEANRVKRDAKRADASQQFRFPPGSTFNNVTWDGERWVATLSVPQPDGTVRQFHETGTGVEKVLRALKERYLESVS